MAVPSARGEGRQGARNLLPHPPARLRSRCAHRPGPLPHITPVPWPMPTGTALPEGPSPIGPDEPRSRAVSRSALLLASVPVVLLVAYISLRREMWLDEYHSWMVADSGWVDAWRFVLGDVHPPTYFALLKVWVTGFGDSPLALRSLSLLFHLIGSLFFAALCVKVFAERWVAAAVGCRLPPLACARLVRR